MRLKSLHRADNREILEQEDPLDRLAADISSMRSEPAGEAPVPLPDVPPPPLTPPVPEAPPEPGPIPPIEIGPEVMGPEMAPPPMDMGPHDIWTPVDSTANRRDKTFEYEGWTLRMRPSKSDDNIWFAQLNDDNKVRSKGAVRVPLGKDPITHVKDKAEKMLGAGRYGEEAPMPPPGGMEMPPMPPPEEEPMEPPGAPPPPAPGMEDVG